MFIMHRMRQRGPPRINQNMEVIDAFNAVHGGMRVRVEWGIGGLKRKWRKLMKKFEATIGKFPHLFRACAILTNFLQRRRLDIRAFEEGVGPAYAGWNDADDE